MLKRLNGSLFVRRSDDVLKLWPEKYPGEADDFQRATEEFMATGRDDYDQFVSYCATAPHGSAARLWFERRVVTDKVS